MNKAFAQKLLIGIYALTTLLSALLLFEVQPIISKFILPWFGGSPAVWTTCLVFFQTLLFGGYAYAHLSVEYLRPRWQAVVHLALLATSVLMLPIAPDLSWREGAGSAPTWRILCLLTVSVGLPYFVLSATGPLLQAWFCRSLAGRSPYRLYALSNVGSLVALLGYPFYVEPRFAVGQQTWLWGAGFVGFAALCALGAVCAARVTFPGAAASATEVLDAPPAELPTWRRRAAWVALPALASMMLLATTNHVCQDVAVMPFFWVAPLALYLLSFIICFDHTRWYARTPWAVATLVALLAVIALDQLITGGSGLAFSFGQELTLHFVALFCLCMVCHGELVRLRPDPRHLTSFYLMISAGGALGGMFVSLVAPHVFKTFAEWRWGLVLGCLLAGWVVIDGQQQSFLRRRFALIAPALFLLFVGLNCVPQFQAAERHELYVNARNFYGAISVVERDFNEPAKRRFNFYSGRIVHGIQFTAPDRKDLPTAYYGRSGGAGQAFAALAPGKQQRVGAIGLGIGTIASYIEPGQSIRFYELNPDVLELAERYFFYLEDCRGECQVVLGDGRLSLENEDPQHFDLLVLDAFSGDAVPTHLLTKEAFEIYLRHLQPHATVAVNISNRYLDLSPVLTGLADHFGFAVERVISPANDDLGQCSADWMLLTRPEVAQTKTSAIDGQPVRAVLWTDDHSNLFELLK